jgi:hypothetical protein
MTTTTTARRQTPAQARKAAVESDYTPLYVAAGLTDLVAESIKNVVLTTQEKATRRLAELQTRSTEQAKLATGFVRTLPEQVKALPEQVKALPESTKVKLEEWEKQSRELLAEANTTYADLAGRGKKVVDDTLIATRRTTADVKTDVEEKLDEVRSDVVEAVDPAFEAVEETVIKARRTVSGRTATETVTPRSAVKASATRQTNTAKRSAAAQKAAATRKANAATQAAEQATADKEAAEKKAAAARSATKKAAAKKAAANA